MKNFLKIFVIIICLGLVIPTLNTTGIITKSNQIGEKNFGDNERNPLYIANGTNVLPWTTILDLEQIDQNSIDIRISPIFENITTIFLINTTEISGNNIVIKIDSIKNGNCSIIDNSTNFSSNFAHKIINNLTIGTYNVTVIENTLNTTIVNSSVDIELYGKIFDENDILGTLGVFKGAIDNDTLYMAQFSANPVLPPSIFNITSFWMNSTDQCWLLINLSNFGFNISNVNFSLYSNNISIDNESLVMGDVQSNDYICPIFNLSTEDLAYGIANLSYYLNYSRNSTEYCISGIIPVGIYEASSIWINNTEFGKNALNITIISPFGDIASFNNSNYSSVTVTNGSIWLPQNQTSSINFSNFTVSRGSRFLNLIAGAIVGAVCGVGAFVATAASQYLAGEEIDWGKAAMNGLKAGVGGFLIGATFGAASVAVGAGVAAKGFIAAGVISGGIGCVLDAANQYADKGYVNVADCLVTGISDGLFGAGLRGMQYSQALGKISTGMKANRYLSDKYLPTSNYWKLGESTKNWQYFKEAVDAYVKVAPYTTLAKQTYNLFKGAIIVSDICTLAEGLYIGNKVLNKISDDYGSEFVQDLIAANPSFKTLLSTEDSDGDGVSNIDELTSGTNPIDSNDGPITIDIISPSSSHPALVGNPSNPITFIATVDASYPILNPDFTAEINGESASVSLLMSNTFLDSFILRVFPPTLSNEGDYDLEIPLSLNGETKDTDTEVDAIKYSTGGNIDVMTVIDRSGSMSGSPIAAAKVASSLFVDLMSINDKIGVASYATSASTNYPLTSITSDTIKQQAKNAINSLSASGSTAMGEGLIKGRDQLITKGNSGHPWSIILLSDGYHNTGIHPYDVLPSILSANIRVFTIGLGSDVDESLMSFIAHNSGGGGGEYYQSPSEAELNAIYNSISGIVKSESTVFNVDGSVNTGDIITHDVTIDSSIDTATFTLSWDQGECDLSLIRPNGNYVDITDSDVLSHVKEATYETFTIDNPSIGVWIMEISRVSTRDALSYYAIVTAKTNVTLTCFNDKETYSKNEPIKLVSTLTKGGIPITEATINVEIRKPGGTIEQISLVDDGSHGDIKANDGVYSNSYANTDVSGSYTFTIKASGTVGSEVITREIMKSIYVSGQATSVITVNPTSIDLGIINLSDYEQKFINFTVESTCPNNVGIELTVTDLIGDTGDVISSDSFTIFNKDFILPSNIKTRIYLRMLITEYAEDGNYLGYIILRNEQKSVSIPITFYLRANIPPVADANGPYYADIYEPILFDGSGSYDLDGEIVSYSWTFGDGNTGTGINPTYSYQNPGIYEITLNVTDDNGDSNTATSFAHIRPDTVYVDDGYNTGTPGWMLDHFNRINDGIQGVTHTRPGIVYVNNGIYTEPGDIVVNNDNILLTGVNPVPLNINLGSAAIISDKIVINANGVTFSNFAVNPSAGTPALKVGSSVDASTIVVQHNKFLKNSISNAVGVENQGAAILDVRYNWWGAVDGPSGGVADAVTGQLANGGGVKINSNGPVRFDQWAGVLAKGTVRVSGKVLYFDGSKSFAYHLDGTPNTISEYYWTFGDGTSSTQKTGSHVYKNPGAYTVTLRIRASDLQLWSNFMYDWAYFNVVIK